jgi:hypothetical protein
MRTFRLIALTTAALGAVVALSLNAAASPANKGDKTFTVFEHQTEIGTRTASSTGFTVDDTLALSSDLFTDSTQKMKVGVAGVKCTVTSIKRGPAGQAECTFTAWLSGGQITTAGLVDIASATTPGGTFTLPVVGGSGRYRDAQGVVNVNVINRTDSTDTFNLN